MTTVVGVRRSRWDGAAADLAHAHLQGLPVFLADLPEDAHRAYDLSRRYDEHPVYDMVYLALAERLSAVLVTADARLLGRVGHLPYVRGVQG